MTIQWSFQSIPGVGILSVSGYLGCDAANRFRGAAGWALARGEGPLVLDVSALHGWSSAGQDLIHDTALLLAPHQRPLELAGLPADGTPLAPVATCPAVRRHHDLATALASHRALLPSQGPAHRQWRTTRWPHTPTATSR